MKPLKNSLYFLDYLEALRVHYPAIYELGEEEVVRLTQTGLGWLYNLARQTTLDPPRFVKPKLRSLGYAMNVKNLSYPRDCHRSHSVALSYKGVLHLKSVFDQVLYANLLWELQPRTVFELGLLQGGSALWFADQLDVQCGGGEVHGFERFVECVHPTVRHPRLHIHPADLNDIESIVNVFEDAPRPWLVVDDAHANLEGLLPFLTARMEDGDYLVIEDLFQFPPPDTSLVHTFDVLQEAGFWVDTRYTDAFGFNVTQSPNAWLRKGDPPSTD
jgi:cephalosporin hydroxylase